MPKSASIPVAITLISFLLYLYANLDAQPKLTRDEYFSFAINVYNLTTIAGLLFVFARMEKSSNAHFGRVIRQNSSTVITALVLNLILAILSVWEEIF